MFTSNDAYGTKAAVETTDGTICTLANLATYTFDPAITDFTDIITQALTTSGNIFIFYMNSVNAAQLLEQGTSLGLFRTGTTIVLGSHIVNPTFFSSFTASANLPLLLKGVSYFKYNPNWELLYSTGGQQFVENYINQQSTVSSCETIVDSTGFSFLAYNNTCVGLDFNSLTVSNLTDYIGHTYDAVYLLAFGLESLINNGTTFSPMNYLNTILSTGLSFTGVSGSVSLLPGVNGYKQGNREVGQYYELLNFNPDKYAADPTSEGFDYVAIVSLNEGFHSCDKSIAGCGTFHTNTYNARVPNGYPPYSFDNAPAVIKIGGYFTPFNADYSVNYQQVECLAAFLMAIKEINNNNNLLGNSKIVAAIKSGNGYYDAAKAGTEFITSFYDTGIVGLINSMPNTEAISATNVVTNAGNVAQIITQATDSSLAVSSSLFYGTQVTALDSYAGTVLQDIICNKFGYRKVVIFSTTDSFGTNTLTSFLHGEYCTFTVLGSYIFSNTITDFSSYLQSAKQTGASIFVFLTSSPICVELLKQGKDLEILTAGTQVFGVDTLVSDYVTSRLTSSYTNGLIGIQWEPDYSVKNTAVGQSFLKRWNQQNYTGPVEQYDITVCNRELDDSGQIFLYQSSNGTQCSGLNFTIYNNTKLPNPYASLTYDATYALAYAIDVVLQQGGSRDGSLVKGSNIIEALLKNVSFQGVTGKVKFNKGLISDNNYQQGTLLFIHLFDKLFANLLLLSHICSHSFTILII